MRLNYQKWRESYDKAVGARESAHSQAEYDLYTQQITWLLSVRAHIKGKLHRQRARLGWSDLWHWGKFSYEDAAALAANGGSMVVPVNAHDQQLFIGDSWKDFVIEGDQPGDKSFVEKLYEEPSEPRHSHKNPPPGYGPCTRPHHHEGPCALPFAEPEQGLIRSAINRVLNFLGL